MAGVDGTNCSKCDNDDAGLQCDICNEWWCCSCIGHGIPNMMPDALYAALNDKEFPWVCLSCSSDNILQQLVANQTFTKDELGAFGCNDVILAMIKEPEPTVTVESTADNATGGSTGQEGGTATDESSATDPTTKMMLTLISTLAQNQKEEIKAIVDALKPSQHTQEGSSTAANLPKLQLPTFDGDVVQWHMFWESFQLNVHNQSISDRQKMDYLCQLVKGQAFNKIKGLGADGNKYQEAVRILEVHYGNPVFQKRAHWEALQSLTAVRENMSNLERFNDDLRSTVLAMKRCGINDDALNGYVPEITKKLPSSLVMKMNEMRMIQGKAMEDVFMDELVEFVQQYMAVVAVSSNKTVKRMDSQPSSEKTSYISSPKSVPTMNLNQHAKPRPSNGSSTGNASHRSCVFCKGTSHYSDDCRTVVNLHARRKNLAGAGRCFNCLGLGHKSKECRRVKPCFHCKRQWHHSAVCPTRHSDQGRNQSSQLAGQMNETSSNNDDSSNSRADSQNKATIDVQAHLNQTDQDDGIVMPAFPCQVMNPETKKVVTLLVYADGGARRTCISKDAATMLQLNSKKRVSLVVGRFNSSDEDNVDADVVKATLCGPNGFKLNITGYSVPTTAPPLKVGPIKLSQTGFNHLRQTKPINSPPNSVTSLPIDIMLGQDYYNCIFGPQIKTDKIENTLYVYYTKLGNVMCGNARSNGDATHSTQLLHNMLCLNFEDPIEKLWKLDTIGITGYDEQFNRKDEAILQRFNDTLRKTENRYEVGFPWKHQPCELSSNYNVAKQRLESTIRALTTNNVDGHRFRTYNNIIADQLDDGVIEKVDLKQRDGPITHYIAHFPVIRDDKATTKIRIVYDASVPTKTEKKSLNDLIYAGPCMLNDLTGILLRFRMGNAVMVADIEKAFLQVGLRLEDRDATRFLWLKDPRKMTTNGNLQIYRFARLPFGIIASPHLLGTTIKFHLDQYDDNTVAAQLQRNIYVDNVIINVNSTNEARTQYSEAKQIFNDAGMNLREWMTNDPRVKEAIPQSDLTKTAETKILGIKWDSTQDTINVTGGSRPHDKLTKRRVLGAVAEWYDPLGLVSPITIQPRALIQNLWKQELKWDELLPDESQAKWLSYNKELALIPAIRLPRQAGILKTKRSLLLAFTDASQTAYAACIYLWQDTEDGITCNLVFSKARLAPLKPTMTIPKLELTAVLIGVRALRFVRSQLDVEVETTILWTDSQIVLHWLHSTKDLPTYVTRRKEEILKDNDFTCHYVPTKCNPADLATRGCTVAQLQQSNWFNGPEWLRTDPKSWPQHPWNSTRSLTQQVTESGQTSSQRRADTASDVPAEININQVVIKPTGIHNIQTPKHSLVSTLRTTAYVLRFIGKLKKKRSNDVMSNVIRAEEIKDATLLWLKAIQEAHFAEEIAFVKARKFNQLIKQLDLQMVNGLLRCGGRLEHAFENAFPVLLPKNDKFTEMVIMDAHEKVFHFGAKATLAKLRENYWIPQGYSQVRKVLRACVICRRVQGQSFTAPRMAALPLERVQRSTAFKFTGLDYMGPLQVKEQGEYQKKWVALFSCFTTRAIHLELVDDCSTEALIQAVIRFIGRRGKPAQILSDNATQFKKGASVLKTIFGSQVPERAIDELTTFFTSNRIEWNFIPESSPWVGGFYERMVGLVKRSLKKVLWKSAINTTTLQTVLAQLEGVINTRPLLMSTSDPADKPLCPANFIGPSTQLAVPPSDDDPDDPEYLPDKNAKKTLLRQWQTIERKLNSFWKIWQMQYLQELRESHQVFHRSRHGTIDRKPKVGEICLIKEATPRATWKMGRVQNLMYGSDGEVRFVNIMLPTKHVTRRGVKDLVPLEADITDEEEVTQTDGSVNSRPGEDVEIGRHRAEATNE